jgi:V/A-type H+/Na+-transporting ATPase subunit I
MIADMAQITLLARKRDAAAVVAALQGAGVVHLDPLVGEAMPKAPLPGPEAEARAALERQLARLDTASAALGIGAVAPDPAGLQGKNLMAYLDEVGAHADRLVRQHQELESDAQLVASFLTPARAIAELAGNLAGSRRLASVSFLLDPQKPQDQLAKLSASLGEALPSRFAVGSKVVGGIVAAVKKEDLAVARTALSRAGISELRFPGRFEAMNLAEVAKTLAEREKALPSELQANQTQMRQLASQHGATLRAARLEVLDELARSRAFEAAARGKYGVAFQGWIPTADKPKLEAALAQFGSNVILETQAAPTHHASHVPVKLVNNPVFSPFELLLKFFPPPGYGTFDPTFVLGIFFPLFFGFIIGDMGYALFSGAASYALLGMAANGKSLNISFMGVVVPPKVVGDIGRILAWMAFWTFVWGAIYGEFFGNLGEYLGWISFPGEAERGTIYEAPLHRVAASKAIDMMNLALIPGVFQVLYGWFVRLSNGIRHGDKKHTFEGLGMILGLIGLIAVAFAYRNPEFAFNNILYIGAGVLFAAFLGCTFVAGIPIMILEVVSNGGNILSYLRLYAVGLSGAILANLATDTGWNLGNALGVPGILLGIVVASTIHLFAIAVTIIGHTLQPLRLHYVEFFTKTGFYEESGRPYNPLARLNMGQSPKS